MADQLTTAAGHPIGNKLASMSLGPRGPLLLQDHVFQDEMSHFDRERIPERVVHAKGGGELTAVIMPSYSPSFLKSQPKNVWLCCVYVHYSRSVANMPLDGDSKLRKIYSNLQ